jgi:hypothetical protein
MAGDGRKAGRMIEKDPATFAIRGAVMRIRKILVSALLALVLLTSVLVGPTQAQYWGHRYRRHPHVVFVYRRPYYRHYYRPYHYRHHWRRY